MRFDIKRDGFLHPVLGQRDYYWPNNTFTATVRCQLVDGGSSLRITTDFGVDVPTMNELIDGGSAVCAVWMYCQKTAYRELLVASDGSRRRLDVRVDTAQLRSQVELHPQVIAREHIHLSLTGSHQAYGTGRLRVAPGSPLAVHPATVTGLSDDDLAVWGMFRLEKRNEHGKAWNVHADPRELAVTLSADEDTLQHFQTRRSEDPEWPVRTLYLAALTESIHIWMENYDYDGWPDGGWGAAIRRQLDERGITVNAEGADSTLEFTLDGDYRSPTWVAQRLLGDPLRSQSDHAQDS